MLNITPELPLRLGCAFVNLYAGFYLVVEPARYHKYVPGWLQSIANSVATVDGYLRLQGVGELLIAAVMLGWFLPRVLVKIAASMLAVEMALILVFIGVDSVTFRNVGLLAAALSLLIEVSKRPETVAETQAVPVSPAYTSRSLEVTGV